MFKTSQASDVGSIFTAPNGRSTHSGELLKTFSTNRNRRKITWSSSREPLLAPSYSTVMGRIGSAGITSGLLIRPQSRIGPCRIAGKRFTTFAK